MKIFVNFVTKEKAKEVRSTIRQAGHKARMVQMANKVHGWNVETTQEGFNQFWKVGE